jgi:serine/threonine-protein kinase
MSMDRQNRPTPRSRGANVTDEIENICKRALAVNPGERFANVAEFWAALSAAATKTRAATTMQRAVPSQIPGVTLNPLAATGMAPTGHVAISNVPNSMQATNTGRISALPNSAMPNSMPASMTGQRPSMPSAAQWMPPPPTPPGYGPPPQAPTQMQQPMRSGFSGCPCDRPSR